MPLNTIPNKGLTSRGYPSDRLVTPIIINGDMSVAQRGTSSTGITSNGYYTVDRFEHAINYGTYSHAQSTDVPTGQGFANSFKLDCTTSGTPSAGHVLIFRQKFEGQNLQNLKKGTSSAESLTLSFWVKSNKTGTYITELFDVDNQRQISKSYTINSSDTWEKKIINFDGDTSGTLGNDNGNSMQLSFWLGAGTQYTSGTLSTTWTSNTNANRAVGQVNFADSTSNEWYITGVQLEVGEFDSTTIPSFPFESYESNLRKCQRYYEDCTGSASVNIGNAYNTTQARTYFQYRVKKRAAPTITLATAGNGAGEISFLTKNGGYVGTIGTHTALNVAIDRFDISVNSGTYSSTGWNEGDALFFYTNGNNYVIWEADAEL